MSQAAPSVIVLANCTHISLAAALRMTGAFSRVESAELYSMSDEQREQAWRLLDGYDYILTIEHAASFGNLATVRLKEQMGDKIVSLPTPFFAGTVPDMAYLTYGGSITRSAAVLGDYHSALVLEEVRAGYGKDEIVDRYVSGKAFDRLNVEAIWQASLNELRQREARCEISISDYIEQSTADGTISDAFLSFNHPREGLINYIVRKFVRRVTGQDFAGTLMTAEAHNLYQDARWPLHPAVAERLGIARPTLSTFKQPERMGGEVMEPAEFVARSVDFFTTDMEPAEFKIMTPDYLAPNLTTSAA